MIFGKHLSIMVYTIGLMILVYGCMAVDTKLIMAGIITAAIGLCGQVCLFIMQEKKS